MKTPLGTEVDLGPGHIALDGVPPHAKRAQSPPPHLFGRCLLWPRSPTSATVILCCTFFYCWMCASVMLCLVCPYQAKRLALETSPKWPILCQVRRKTLTQSVSQYACMCFKETKVIKMWRSSYYDSVVAHYILIWFLTWVYGGQWRFENVGLMLVNVIVSSWNLARR